MNRRLIMVVFSLLVSLCDTKPIVAESSIVYSFDVSQYLPAWGDRWAVNRICWKIMREHPDILIKAQAAIQIENSKGNSQKILQFAGQTAPDVLFTHWWEIQNDIRNNFLCPLNEYVGYDGYYGLDPETDTPNERTGTRKLKRDTRTGQMVPDVNGIIDDDEALWPPWRNVPAISRLVSGAQGELETGPDGQPYKGFVVYGLPQALHTYYGIGYRRDLFRRAGISEKNLPETWDEFWRVCQKLTNPGKEIPGAKFQRGQRAFLLPTPTWQWILWLYAAGGDCIRQTKTNPATGKSYDFSMEETEFRDPETGELLGTYPSTWRAVFAEKGGPEAVRFYQKLVWAPWIINPNTGEPLDLSEDDVRVGKVTNPDNGKVINFTEKEIIRGVVRHTGEASDDAYTMFRRGEVAMMMVGVDRLERAKMPAANLGFMPIPAGPGGHSLVGYYRHFRSLNVTMKGKKQKARRDKAWIILSTLCGPEAQRDFVDNKVRMGYARFLTPDLLRIAGREEYIDQILPYWRDNYARFTARARTEPFMGNWAAASAQINRKVISFLTLKPDFNAVAALKDVQRESNQRIMFGMSKKEKDRYRPWARIFVPLVFIIFIGAIVLFIREQMAKNTKGGGARTVYAWWAPPLMLAPALVSVALWSYYPLIRGSAMAFQDYRIGGGTTWVGLDNFITVFFTKDFWIYLSKTFKYVAMALGLGFFTPVITALLLSEVPRFKGLFRTVYFLPQVSSGLVIMLIWKLLYNPTEFGLLNRGLLALNGLSHSAAVGVKILLLLVAVGITWVFVRVILILCDRNRRAGIIARWILAGIVVVLTACFLVTGSAADFIGWLGASFDLRPQNWLGDKRWAMMAVILPGVWSQAGIGSLIYLAALKSVDEESYEAAEIDGCTFWEKLVHITIPYLKPLIIINFIGAFISTFHAMGNIFAMTGGGPGDETTVLSLAIWYEAFAFMNFGTATAMAWFLGLMLIGFTVYQLKILNKVDFRRAGD